MRTGHKPNLGTESGSGRTLRRRTARWKSAAGVAGVVVFLAVGVLRAHHAASIYDRDNHVTLRGTVTEYVFTSPHVRIHFEAKDDNGNLEKWIALSAPPQRLYRSGWNVRSLKAGDEITVTGAPMKDGTRVVNIRRLVGPTGQVLTEGAD
jgi:hypothetical protein